MKYIIEIEEKPLCVFDKDTQTFFPRLWRVKGFNSLVLDEEGLSRLEELNSDYINEHFGGLQDDAYNKGYAQCQDDYGDALKHAKDTAYKKGLEDGKAVNNKGCEGCLYNDGTKEHSPCDICCNAYLNRWTAKPQEDDDIKVGDEVEWTGDKYIVTYINYDIDTSEITDYDLLGDDGSVADHVKKCSFTKTGRHFDIQSILEGMRND